MQNFYPRSPCGERPFQELPNVALEHFYPRSPCGERPGFIPLLLIATGFLSTLSLRRATLRIENSVPSDLIFLSTLSLRRATSPARGGAASIALFLSTLSLRRATRPSKRLCCCDGDFYPRSPCGERPGVQDHGGCVRYISIHALLAESDTPLLSRVVPTPIFLSTLSLRRATLIVRPRQSRVTHFYPRSPCGERLYVPLAVPDLCKRFLSTLSLRRATPHFYIACRALRHFYPRSPCGERLNEDRYGQQDWRFLSTLSLRRATIERSFAMNPKKFLSTLSLRRATRQRETSVIFAFNFYPRSPCGERPETGQNYKYYCHISIHALLAESDRIYDRRDTMAQISIHALLAESDAE